MEKAIEKLLQKIKDDYITWCSKGKGYEALGGYFKESVDNHDDKMQVKVGQKYIKIIRENSVWGFIVNTDNDKVFKKGDILKAAGWNAPARNAARGNILDDDYYINWTGPLYLR
jgi:hypothetical protein|tara:strand:- start:2216 stop:2557 length:342 start_codon:yes stop_codon:yes gene_type:complete